jgi:hypothetical protein
MRCRLWLLSVSAVGCLSPSSPSDDARPQAPVEQPATDTGWSGGSVPTDSRRLQVDIHGPDEARVGCPIDATVTLTNTGEVPVQVHELGTEGDGWQVESLDISLEPAASVTVSLHRSGDTDTAPAPGLVVQTDADDLTGGWRGWSGSSVAAAVSEIEVEAPRLDALDVVVVASPEGMVESYPGHAIYEGLPVLADALSAAGIDWQLTLVGSPTGCPSAAWPLITPETSGWDTPEALLASMNGATKCDVYGRELSVAGETLQQLDPGACAELSHRAGTPMWVVLVRFGGVSTPESGWDSMLADMYKNVGEPPLQIDEVVESVRAPADDWLDAIDGRRHLLGDWTGAIPSVVEGLPVSADFAIPVSAADPHAVVVTVDGAPNDAWQLVDGVLAWDDLDRPAPGAKVEVQFTDASECPSAP